MSQHLTSDRAQSVNSALGFMFIRNSRRVLGFRGSWRPIQHRAMEQTVQSLFGDWREVQEVLMRPNAAKAKAGTS